MTRNEAIKAIKGFNENDTISPYNPRFREALDMAIDALNRVEELEEENDFLKAMCLMYHNNEMDMEKEKYD